MAIVVIRTKNNHRVATETLERRRKLWRRGDVVAVLEDGVDPGAGVRRCPHLGIIEVPGTAAEFTELIEHVVIGEDTVRRRRRRLDLPALVTFLQDKPAKLASWTSNRRVRLGQKVELAALVRDRGVTV